MSVSGVGQNCRSIERGRHARAPQEAPLIPQNEERAVLLCHDGELADILPLVEALEVPVIERMGPLEREDRRGNWDLVVGSPARVVEIGPRPDGALPQRIAILDNPPRTLMSMLERSGVGLCVRRPFHLAALRLLVLHALYRGDEKRRRRRVAVGARVKFRTGLRRRPALLVDLSTRGCRLLTQHAARHGSVISLILPNSMGGGRRSFPLTGRVVRTGPATGEEVGTQNIAVVFDPLSKDQALKLKQIVDRHVRGPAMLSDTAGEGQAERRKKARPESRADRRAPPPASEAKGPRQRRAGPRVAYRSRVIALGEEAASVLVGRDLSVGGMRVDPHPEIRQGDKLQLALHLGERAEPLVVEARVERDEGDCGLALQFRNLDTLAREHIGQIVHDLSETRDQDMSCQDCGVVVSQIIVTGAAVESGGDQHTNA